MTEQDRQDSSDFVQGICIEAGCVFARFNKKTGRFECIVVPGKPLRMSRVLEDEGARCDQAEIDGRKGQLVIDSEEGEIKLDFMPHRTFGPRLAGDGQIIVFPMVTPRSVLNARFLKT